MLHIHCMVDDDAGVVCESLCPAGALFEGKKEKDETRHSSCRAENCKWRCGCHFAFLVFLLMFFPCLTSIKRLDCMFVVVYVVKKMETEDYPEKDDK